MGCGFLCHVCLCGLMEHVLPVDVRTVWSQYTHEMVLKVSVNVRAIPTTKDAHINCFVRVP